MHYHTSFDPDTRSTLRRTIDRTIVLQGYFPDWTRRECVKQAAFDVEADEYTARAEDRAAERSNYQWF